MSPLHACLATWRKPPLAFVLEQAVKDITREHTQEGSKPAAEWLNTSELLRSTMCHWAGEYGTIPSLS